MLDKIVRPVYIEHLISGDLVIVLQRCTTDFILYEITSTNHAECWHVWGIPLGLFTFYGKGRIQFLRRYTPEVVKIKMPENDFIWLVRKGWKEKIKNKII